MENFIFPLIAFILILLAIISGDKALIKIVIFSIIGSAICTGIICYYNQC